MGALLALFIAYHLYDMKSEDQSSNLLRMVQQEIIINKGMFSFIETNLDKWLKSANATGFSGPRISNRLSTHATYFASQNYHIYRKANPMLVILISGHLLKLRHLNSDLDNFNQYILGSAKSTNFNANFFSSWAEELKKRVKDSFNDSENLYKEISKYLGYDSQDMRLRVIKNKKVL